MPEYAECDNCDPMSLMQERIYDIEDLEEIITMAKDLIEMLKNKNRRED